MYEHRSRTPSALPTVITACGAIAAAWASVTLEAHAQPNGHALFIARGAPPSRDPVNVIVQGSTVATRMLVGELRVIAGVPADIDWTGMRLQGEYWLKRR